MTDLPGFLDRRKTNAPKSKEMDEGRADPHPYELYFIVKRQKKFVDQQGEGASCQIPHKFQLLIVTYT